MHNNIPSQDQYQEIREALRDLCGSFDSQYWQGIDHARGYPEAFVSALTSAGWLAALIPTEYGGSGLGLAEASVIMEEINLAGGNAGSCHGQMYNMGTVLRHGSETQKKQYILSKIKNYKDTKLREQQELITGLPHWDDEHGSKYTF